jgi:hypothetical protein
MEKSRKARNVGGEEVGGRREEVGGGRERQNPA